MSAGPVSLFQVSNRDIRMKKDDLSISDEDKAYHLSEYLYCHCPSSAWMILCKLIAAGMTATLRFGVATADDVDEALRSACKFQSRNRRRETHLKNLAKAKHGLNVARQAAKDADIRRAIDAVMSMVEEKVSLEGQEGAI